MEKGYFEIDKEFVNQALIIQYDEFDLFQAKYQLICSSDDSLCFEDKIKIILCCCIIIPFLIALPFIYRKVKRRKLEKKRLLEEK